LNVISEKHIRRQKTNAKPAIKKIAKRANVAAAPASIGVAAPHNNLQP